MAQSMFAPSPALAPPPIWLLNGIHTFKDGAGGVWKVEEGKFHVTFSGHPNELVFDSPSIRAHEILTYRDVAPGWKERLQVRAAPEPEALFVELRSNCELGEFDGLWELTNFGRLEKRVDSF